MCTIIIHILEMRKLIYGLSNLYHIASNEEVNIQSHGHRILAFNQRAVCLDSC